MVKVQRGIVARRESAAGLGIAFPVAFLANCAPFRRRSTSLRPLGSRPCRRSSSHLLSIDTARCPSDLRSSAVLSSSALDREASLQLSLVSRECTNG